MRVTKAIRLALGTLTATIASAIPSGNKDSVTNQSECMWGRSTGNIYCRNDQIKDVSKLPLLSDVEEGWDRVSMHQFKDNEGTKAPEVSDTVRALVKRNQCAMVCLNEKSFTWDCQNRFGYYCSASGQLRTTRKMTEEGCDLCDCISLHPKSMCLMGLSGQAYCMR